MKQFIHYIDTPKKIGIVSLLLIVIILPVTIIYLNSHANFIPYALNNHPNLTPHANNSHANLTPHAGGKLTYYVTPIGDNNNNGSRSNPFSTIEQAATMAIPGSIIHVLPGNYTTALITYASGNASSPITYISDTKWGAKIQTTGADIAWDNRGDYVNIIGFEISGNGTYGIFNRGSHVHIIGNHIHNISTTKCSYYGGAGISDGPISGDYSGHDNYIIGNIVHDIGPKSPYCNLVHGIYEANGNAYIQNNIVYNNAAWGIHTWHAATNDIISNNLVFGNGGIGGGGGIIIAAGGNGGGVDDHTIVSNNIVVYNANFGIREYNNTGLHNRYLHNLVYANPIGISLQNGIKDQGTLIINPQFINFRLDGSGDYHLKPTSPAIDAGTSIGAPQTDIDGNPRLKGNGYEIGPY